MTKLAVCLLKQAKDFKNFDADEVVGASKIYQSRGRAEDEANILAIEDHLRDLRTQRKAIVDHVLEQFKGKEPARYAEIEAKRKPPGPQPQAINEKEQEIAVADEPAPSAVIDAAAHEAATSQENDKAQPTAAQKEAGNYAVGAIPASATAIGMPISIENPQGSIRWKLDTDRLKAIANGIIDNRHNSEEARKPALAMLDAVAAITGADVTKVEDGFDRLQEAIDGLLRNFPTQQETAQEIFDAGWKTKMQQHYGYIKSTTGRDKDHVDIFLAPGAETASKVWVIDQKNKDGSFDEHKVVLGPETEAEARAAYLANYQPGWDGIGAITSMPIPALKAWVTNKSLTKKPLAYVEPQTPEKATSSPETDPAVVGLEKVGAGETATTEDSSAVVAVPVVPDKTQIAAANPRSNAVIRDVRDRDGNKLGDIIEPYDGTEEGARAAASRATDRMWSEYEDASNIQSRIGATDENGDPKWAISPNFAHINPVDTAEGMATFGDEDAINEVYGATKNSEQLPATPEAESQAPALLESGDGGVAPAHGAVAAEHWLHDEIVNLIHFKGRTQNRRALDKIVELLKRRAAGEDVRSRAVKSYLSGFTKEPAITEVLNRVVTRLETEDKQATADKRKETNQAKKEAEGNGTTSTQTVAQPAKQPEAPAAARRVRFISRGRTAADIFAEAVTDFKDITIPELPGRNFFIHSDGGGQTVITERETGRSIAKGNTEKLAYKALKDVLSLRSPADIEKVIASAPVLSVDQIKDALTVLENKEYAQKIADEQAADAEKSGGWDGKPSYGDKVDTQMRDGDIGAKKNKPYASRAAAVGWIFKNKASDTHEVFQVGKDQFVLRQIAGAQEAADAKKADATHKAAIKAAEVDAFTAMAAAPELLNAETNNPENFAIEAQRQIVKWIGAEMLAASEAGDVARVKALDSLLQDGKPLLPESFFESVRADIQKRIKQAKLDGVKDASRLALVEATVKANVTDDQDKKAFVEGWDHALAGKTKSTLPGDEIHSKGYEAARTWMKTPEGAAAFSGKRAKKLENTGADLRRWFDKQKENISGTDTDAVIAAIDAATTRAELFRSVLGEGATPGAQRWLEAFRNQVLPFKRWLTEKGPLNYRFGYISRRTSDTEIIRGYLDGKIYQPKHEDDTKEQRVAVLRSAAEEYVNLIRDITENLEGRTVAELSQSLEALMMEQKDGRRQSSETGKRVRSMMLQNGRHAYWLLFGDNTAYLKDLIANEANTDQSTRRAKLVPPRLDRVERNGEDFRGSQNVSPESFKRTFNFADVGFGKWVKSKQDQDHLNYSFDAFGDLAKLLGIPLEAISIGGRLHFTIGSLGHGKFAAHYSNAQPHPDGGTVPVINVTNTRGDGTVAHEYGHAFDLTPQKLDVDSPAYSKTGGDYSFLSRAIDEIKRDLKYAYNFDSLRAGVVGHLKGDRWWRGNKHDIKTDAGKIENAKRALDYYSKPSNQNSNYYKAAIKLDGSKAGKDDAYWSNDKELFARAFEGWVGDAMETDNTYLVNPGWSGEGIITEKTHRGTPYALGAERERIAEWMDALRKSLFYDAENKVLGLDFDKWQESKPKHAEEWKRALEDLEAELPSMLEAIKSENRFAEEAAKAAREHAASMRVGDLVRPREGRESVLREKIGDEPAAIESIDLSSGGDVWVSLAGFDRRVPGVNLEIVQTKEQQDAQIAQAQAAEAEAPTPAAEPVGELSDAEIDALLDEAEARVGERSQEQPDAPAPGAPVAALADVWSVDDMRFLRDLVEDGKMPLLSGERFAIDNHLPNIHMFGELESAGKVRVRHLGFGTFEAKGQYYTVTWDAGGAMSHTPGGHAYTLLNISESDGLGFIYPKDEVLGKLRKLMDDGRDANKQKAANLLSGRGGRLETDAERAARESTLPAGWTEASPGGLATNPDQETGGIIDKVMLSNPVEWFVIPHNDAIGKIEGLGSRAEAFQALNDEVARVEESKALLSGLYDRAQKLAEKNKVTLNDQIDKTAAKLIAKAAKQGITGIDEALKGMVKIFGGGPGKLQSFPAGLDEASYKAALPHFKAMLKAFREAGKTLVDLFELFIEEAGAGIRPYLKHFAKEMRLTADLGERASANRTIANYVLDKLSTGADIRWQDLFDVADKAFGGTQADGIYTVKDAYDAMEMGVNLYLEKGNWNASAKTAEHAARDIRNLGRMIAQLPTQTKRTQEMDEFQQFSTPPTLAYAANWVANIRPGEVMLEPSAGTGDLAVFAHNAGANLILNELSGRRATILKELFPRARIFTENAEQLNNVLPGDAVPTVVVMNPPFSATAGRKQGSRDSMNGAKHIEQALKRLEQGGRLVAIVGEGMAADRPAFKEWWKKIAAEYNVRANIGISGKEYAKYGTTFDNQLLVIDKTGSTTNTVVTGKVETVAELPALLEGIRNDRPQAVATIHGPESVADQSEGDGTPAEGGVADGAAVGAGSNEPDAVGTGKRPTSTRPGRSGNADSESGTKSGNEVADGDGQRGRAGSDATGRPASGGRTAAGGTDGVAPGTTGVTLGTAEKQEQGDLTDSVFENYRPQRLEIKGAHEHPGKLVQSAAMAAVEPPAPTYTPNLPAEVIIKGMLSNAQLEAVVYAGQAHEQFLPNGERRGLLIGDGTGVGKGREISGIILDNMRQGRNKAVWVSANEGLMTDAGRDFGGVGGDPGLIFFQGKTKAGGDITAKNGILFTTYPTLRGGEKKQATDTGGKEGKKRINQLVKWLGEDFDGVIVFDEAHAMGNVVETKGKRGTKKASAQALAGVNLQRMLPKARIVYVSATGATEVNNLGYASRLGLWGEGTAFAGIKEFIGKITQGGVAAMELISRDMKALGMYISRSLSFDGVTYERLEHDLTPLQTDIYNELAKAWQVVLENVDAALDITNQGKDGKAKSAAMSRFWGTHQRFFNQVITSMQTPTVIEDMKKQIAAGNAVLIQLVNTNEAEQERQAARAQADGTELEELDFTPRQALMDYVRNAFPVQAYEETTDADGNTIYVPVVDAAGNPVFDQDAIKMRDQLLSNLEAIRVPENPIDAIINAFGSDKVGEVTGRGRRFVQMRDDDGNLKVVEEKRGKHAAQNDATAFQSDKKPILIFSQAGGTGFSFHADNTAKNQRKRIHYILQPGWRADAAVQGFGRSHRTNQKQPPHYVLPTTNLKAQKRFVSSIARRLDQLGALTRGQRQATSQGLFTASDNLESKYADDALEVFFQDMYRGSTPLVFSDVARAMGLNNLIDQKTGALNTTNLPEIPRFLNRLLSLSSTMQDEVFSEFEKRLEEIVAFAVQQGTYDNGMQTLKAESVKKVRDDVAYTDERTGAETRYVEVDVTNPIKYRTFENAENWAKSHGAKFAGWFKNAKGDVFGIADLGERVNAKGEVHRRGAVVDIRDHRLRYVDNLKDIQQGWAWGVKDGRSVKKTISTPVAAESIQAEWEKQVAEAPKHETRREHMIVGVILPVWDRVEGHPRIFRLQTDEGERMIGRIMGPKDAAKTLKNLGLGSSVSKMAPADVLAKIKGGAKAILGNGWEISTAGVSGDDRIEIKIPGSSLSVAEQNILKGQGVFVERITFRERFFIPTGADELKVFERVVKAKPVVDLFDKGAKPGEDGESGAMESRNPVWMGRLTFPTNEPRQPGASTLSDGQESSQPSRIGQRNQTEQFKVTSRSEKAQASVYTDFTGYTADEIRDGLIDAFGARSIRQLEANGLIKIMENAEAFKALFPGVAVSNSAKALFIGDRAYFFANRMHPASSRIELLHEIGEHFGLERLLGAEGYSNLMQRVKSMRDTGQKQLDSRQEGDNSPLTDEELSAGAWNFVVLNYPEEAEGSKRFMHEVLAQLGQNADIQARPWWKAVIEAVKRALVRMGFTGMIRVSDLQDMVMHSLMVAAEPDGGPRGGIRGSRIANGMASVFGGFKAVDTESPEFKAWFGKSVVVDADGKPLRVYHGTRFDFSDFDGYEVTGWFSADPSLSSDRYAFGESDDAGANVMPVYLSIRNPKVIENDMDDAGDGGAPVHELVNDSRYVAKLIEQGYDGIVANENGVKTFAAFSPTQIKSAISNTGEFSENPSILESRGNYLDDLKAGVANTLNNAEYAPRDKAAAPLSSPDVWFKPVLNAMGSALKGSNTFGPLDRSIHSQLHKAQKNRYFGEVFKRVQHFMADASRAALRPAELAPTVLPRIDVATNAMGALRSLLKGKAASADIDAAFNSALRGTLDDRVYATAAEADLTDEQFRIYHEIRDSVDASLDELSAAEAWGIARTIFLNDAGKLTRAGLIMKKDILESPDQAKETLIDRLTTMAEDLGLRANELTALAREAAPFIGSTEDPRNDLKIAMQSGIGNQTQNAAIARALDAFTEIAAVKDTIEKTSKVFERRDQLQKEGYVPLMRFGQHYLTITRIDPMTGEAELDEHGDKVTEYFSLFESASERDKAEKALREEFADASVEFDSGTMSEEEWRRYKGVSPESVALFAGKLGIGTDDVFQEWYRLAASNRSTLRRLIHRKGTPGFSEDGSRVMAAFLTSNGRRASMLYHMADVQEAIEGFPRQQGAEKDEAIKLVEYIQNPDEEASAPRALMFMHFLGGSISNFFINASQPAMVTLPYISQFVGMPRAMALLKEAYSLRGHPEAMSQELRDALAKADQEGKVGAQEIHHLWQETARPLISKMGRFGEGAVYRANAFMQLWGMPFAVAELMNRQVTFISAYNAAKEQGGTPAQAYSKAILAVDETQFIYGKQNRPNWARGTLGSLIFTFRLFSISYTELLVRMLRGSPESRKAGLYMLGMLFMAAGAQGMPGADDLDDLIDTIAQMLGYNVSSKLSKRKFVENLAGKEVADFTMHGLSALSPLDVSGRMGLGNLLPGTGLLKPSNTRKESDLLEIIGPIGGLSMSYINTSDAVSTGNWNRAFTEWMPKALKDLARGAEMATSGEARDGHGNKITDINPLEAFVKSVGFNPQSIAELGRNTRDVQQTISFARRNESIIAEKWARGIVEGNQGDIQAARNAVVEWNATNPDTPIDVKYSAVARRVAAMKSTKEERFVKAATKGMREYAKESIE